MIRRVRERVRIRSPRRCSAGRCGRVPEDVVLLVHLVKAIGRLFVWALRHPVVTGVVAGPVALGVLVGWGIAGYVITGLVLLMAAGLGGWAWRWPGSFETRVHVRDSKRPLLGGEVAFYLVEARGFEPLTPCLQSRCSAD